MPPSQRSTDELLNAKRERARRLKAQIADLEQRKRKQDRRRDARRTFVVGAAALSFAEVNEPFREALRIALQSAVTREADRELIADLVDG